MPSPALLFLPLITWEGAGIYFVFVTNDCRNGPGEYAWLAERNVHIVDIGSRTCNLLKTPRSHFKNFSLSDSRFISTYSWHKPSPLAYKTERASTCAYIYFSPIPQCGILYK